MSDTSQDSIATRGSVETEELIEAQTFSQREALHDQLKGLTVQIPDLKPIFFDWEGTNSTHVNQNMDFLKLKVHERLKIFGFDDLKREKLEAADFALFTVLWWPEASVEKLEILAYLVIWLFTWDDEIDEPTGIYSNDLEAAQLYRKETLQSVRFHLGLSTCDTGSSRIYWTEIIQRIDVVCHALRQHYNTDQLERFYREITRFVTASEQEQRGRLEETIPTLQDFWEFRLGTSAVYIASAVGEFAMSSNLSPCVIGTASMQKIWDETNTIISITNDLFSLKKEVRLGCVDNTVSLIFACTGDIQGAVDASVAALQEAKERFETAAEDLLAVTRDKEDYQQVAKFVHVQKSNCVGNLIWSLETDRYKMRESLNEDGSHTFIM